MSGNNGLKLHEVQINGITHTLKLSAEDAERYGDLATPVDSVTPQAPLPKAGATKGRAPANKSRTAGGDKTGDGEPPATT